MQIKRHACNAYSRPPCSGICEKALQEQTADFKQTSNGVNIHTVLSQVYPAVKFSHSQCWLTMFQDMINYDSLRNWQFWQINQNYNSNTILTAVTISNPASAEVLTAKSVIILPFSDRSSTSLCDKGNSCRSTASKVSRRKWVTFEKPPIVALYGSWMNFWNRSKLNVLLVAFTARHATSSLATD